MLFESIIQMIMLIILSFMSGYTAATYQIVYNEKRMIKVLRAYYGMFGKEIENETKRK